MDNLWLSVVGGRSSVVGRRSTIVGSRQSPVMFDGSSRFSARSDAAVVLLYVRDCKNERSKIDFRALINRAYARNFDF